MSLTDKLTKAKLSAAAALAEVAAKTYVVATSPIVISGTDIFPGLRDHPAFALPFVASFLGACAYVGYRMFKPYTTYEKVKESFGELEELKQKGE